MKLTPLGVELLCAAHGYRTHPALTYLSEDMRFEIEQEIELGKAWTPPDNSRPTGDQRHTYSPLSAGRPSKAASGYDYVSPRAPTLPLSR
jgi:hypothetical protein